MAVAFGCRFCGQKRRAQAKDPFSSQLDQLEGDENDGYLGNGGDSDPAETTVGKLSISCVDSTCDMCNTSGRGIRGPIFRVAMALFWAKL